MWSAQGHTRQHCCCTTQVTNLAWTAPPPNEDVHMEVKPRSLVRSISISLRTRFKVVCPVVLARAIESSIIEEEKKVFANYLQHSSVGTTPMERKGFRQAHTILENHIRNMDTGYLILESDVQYKSGYISKW
jgi:hypothetical protein